MKRLVLITLLALGACGGKERQYAQPADALDAGREYIQACMEGDFDKAVFYVLPDEKNKLAVREAENVYRSKDREGRQQLRTASININAVNNLPDGSMEIRYQYSFDRQPRRLIVVPAEGSWRVNAAQQ